MRGKNQGVRKIWSVFKMLKERLEKKKNIGTAKIGILGKEMCNNTAQAEAFT